MNIGKIYQLLLISSFFYFTLLNCSSKSPTEEINLVSFSEKWFGGFNVHDMDNLVISNRIGSIYLYGNGLPDTLRAYLYKNISAETQNKADKHFDDISLEHNFVHDSVICSITSPSNSNLLEYYCRLDLEVTGKLQTYIQSPNYGVSLFYMDTTVYVLDSGGDIDLMKHSGSCDLKTLKGDIFTELIIRNNGFCRCNTSKGNIIVVIPSNTSATIYARTDEGVVSYSNLSISNLQESQGLLTGVLSDGNGEIRLETKKGNIELKGFATVSSF
jgi:hypothetical protein